jgi:transglutaminase-like putative cysteine protease/tetratricopeptide (TPR) repeat protein
MRSLSLPSGVVGLLLASAVAAAPPPSSGDDGFARELAARRARFEREGARPQALVPLLGVLELWDLLPDRAPLVAFLDAAAGAAAARPEVRARAAYLRSIVLDRLGRHDEAETARRALGLMTRFWLVGPFDNEGRAGHGALFGPETAAGFDSQASWPGKERSVAWRLLPSAATTQGMVVLESVLRPEGDGTAYLTVAVRAPRKLRAALRVGSSGAIKAWVNGRLALDHDVYRPVRFDQDAAPAELEAGWNRLTLKLSASDGTAELFARFTAPDGAPLDELTFSTEPADLRASPAGRGTFAGAVADVGRELERAAAGGDAAALADLGLYLHHVAPEDPQRHRAADRLALAARRQPSAEAFRRLAEAQLDPNDQRKALEEGLAVAAAAPRDRAGLLTALGDLDRARRERRAESLWLAARAADPSYYPALLRLAELSAERGLPARAAAMLRELVQTTASLKVLRAAATLAQRRGRRDEAEALYRRIRGLEHDDVEAMRELYGYARARGAIDAALALLDELAAARPDLPTTLVDRAELLEGVGRRDEAHRALEAALAIAPEDAKLLERDGRLLHRMGREPEALTRLRRALELRPQNPELRAYLVELEPRPQARDPHADLQRAYAEDPLKVIARTRKSPIPDGAPARVLLDLAVTRVHSNGLSEAFQQRLVEILDDRGARDQGDFDIRFSPDAQAVEVRTARIYKKDGEIVEAAASEERDLSEPWYGLYYDVRAQVVHLEGLAPGDVIDVEYVVSDVGRRNAFADYFGDLHFFQEELPRLESRYVLLAPMSRTLYFNQPRLAGLVRSDEEAGDEHIYRFRAVDVPKIDSEPGMPGFSDVAAYVHVSTYRAWQDVAAWYEGLLRGQLDATPAITQAVAEATRGLRDERAKIHAIYDLVVRRTRYVGLEFGIHGFQPYRVGQVFARKFGDCKDKASLLVVMLKEAGIPAALVLARTRRGGDLDPEPASLAPFDHAIAYVPKYDLFLDGTAEFSGAEELPAQDQDIPVLQVAARKLLRTPVAPATKNRVVTDWRVALEPTGAARVEEHLTVAGEAAHEWRSHYQAPGERVERYDQAWNGKHPGARVAALEMALDDRERPVEVHAGVEVPHWGHPTPPEEGAGLAIPVLGREADMLRSYARLSSRRYDLELGYPWRQEDRITLLLPSGWSAKRLPEAATVRSDFGTFTLRATAARGEVVVSSTLEVVRHRIARADYAAFRKFCADVDAAVAQELVVAP